MCRNSTLYSALAATLDEPMFRYLIAIGNPQSATDCESLTRIRRRAHASPAGWQDALNLPEFYAVYVHHRFSREPPILLHADHGVIFGSLYLSPTASRAGSSRSVRFISRDDSERIVDSKGRSLISDCWGHYVAAIRQPGAHSAMVVRSPASMLACHHLQEGTLNVFFSHVEDCMALIDAPMSINWDSITAQVVGYDYLSNETAIDQIRTVESGECIECSRERLTRHVYWDPRQFLGDSSLDDFGAATRAIRDAVQYSVSASSSAHDTILVKLSGGLDSSIVLSALSEAPHAPALTAITYHSRGCGDERRFARSMAETIGCRLIESPRNDTLDLRRFGDCNWTARPVLNFSAPDTESRNIALARELGASAIFDGELGDNIFGSDVGAGALVDCFRRHPLSSRLLGAVADYAILSRQSLWRTMRLAFREYIGLSKHPDFIASHEVQRWYTAEAVRSMTLASEDAHDRYQSTAHRFQHPWLRDARSLAPGSHLLLYGIIVATSTAHHSPFAGSGDPPRISPLISQPLVETALRVPAYLHFKNAENRALARAAFADRLPALVLQRGTGKGGPDLWAKDVIERNLEFLREYFLDGILVQRGLLDRRKVEAVVSRRIEKSTAILSDVFAKLYIEAWLRKWPRMRPATYGSR
jgi:asparagine synthase (glutamine-hydrolysing)